MNYMIFLSYGGSFSCLLTLLAVVFEVSNIMNFIVGLCCMMACILIFSLVTGINIHIERFLFVIILMNVANFFIFFKVGNNKWNDCLQISGVSLFYTVHYIHRVGLMMDGMRLDVNQRDYIYGGLINFMDVPYYLVGIANIVLPISSWAELNEELPLEYNSQKPTVKPTKNKQEEKATKKDK